MKKERTCRICGCTQNNACKGGCFWVEDNLCSKCVKKVKIPKCFSKDYTQSVVLHGGLVCWGGFGQPSCKHLLKCVEQFKDSFTPRKFNNLIKKIKNYGK